MERSFELHGIEFVCQIIDGVGHIRDFPEVGVITGGNDNSIVTLLEKELKAQWHYYKRSPHQFRVDVFMQRLGKLNGQKVRYEPTTEVTDEERMLRAKLIMEEVLELVIKGLGVELSVDSHHDGSFDLSQETLMFNLGPKVDLLQIADGTADVKVVVTGTQSCFGIDDEPVQAIVDFNNLSKFGLGHSIRADKKLVKPADFEGPEKLLQEYLDESQRTGKGSNFGRRSEEASQHRPSEGDNQALTAEARADQKGRPIP